MTAVLSQVLNCSSTGAKHKSEGTTHVRKRLMTFAATIVVPWRCRTMHTKWCSISLCCSSIGLSSNCNPFNATYDCKSWRMRLHLPSYTEEQLLENGKWKNNIYINKGKSYPRRCVFSHDSHQEKW
jgi:hypothetical protein